MVFAKAIFPIEGRVTVAFVATWLSTSRALASVPIASAAFRVFVTFAFAFSFAFAFGQLVDGRLLSRDSGLKVFDSGESILILFWLPCRIHSLKFLPLVDSFLDPQVELFLVFESLVEFFDCGVVCHISLSNLCESGEKVEAIDVHECET